jgi:urease accessory protein
MNLEACHEPQGRAMTMAQMRMLQLASQALPIGGFSHSHGLEAAIESGVVRDEATALRFILDVLSFCLGAYEVPYLARLGSAWAGADFQRVRQLNEEFLATREAAELRGATVQMGFSLRALAAGLEMPAWLTAGLREIDEPTLVCVWSGMAAAWDLTPAASAAAYLWSWAENQVLAAIKAVPLGQSAGQRMLLRLGAAIADVACHAGEEAAGLESNFAPALAILSSQHETQYSRLFRS